MTKIAITYNQFLDYIEENGYPQEFVAGLWGPNDSACAYGQGLLNLRDDVFPTKRKPEMENAFYMGDSDSLNDRFQIECPEGDHIFYNFYGLITKLNDGHTWEIPKIVKFARENIPQDVLNSILGELDDD